MESFVRGDICWLTEIYALNQIESRKRLSEEIKQLAGACNNEWCVMGDFNNVLKMEDRIGGAPVQIQEYQDLQMMMDNAGLYDCQMTGAYFTWSNKYKNDLIYSRIDHVLGNVDWFLRYWICSVEALPMHISYHTLI